ncbi:MAG TPA: hypothetical protein VM324_07245 [Egibacteraceae bacterium]|nr:hypothetical protein [Egibacteraceae bacterium]
MVGLLLLLAPMPAEAAHNALPEITSAGPLERIIISDELNCQVKHAADSVFSFYPSSDPTGACATLVATGGTLYGPTHIAAGSGATPRTAFTRVSQSAVTGTGTGADPYRLVTVVDLGDTGLRLRQTDSYVVGEESYRTDVRLDNTGSAAAPAIVYRAGDCYLQGSDFGFGRVDANGAVACTTSTAPGARIEQWLPITPGSNHYHAGYSQVWSRIGAQLAFPDTCRCNELIDNGAGLSWTVTVPAGGALTLSHLTTFSPIGNVPLTTTKTAASPTTPAGGQNSYTITVTNPNVAAATLDTITDTLPAGFSYVAGSSSGATVTDPAVVGQALTWSGPFTVPPDGGTTSLAFNVVVAATPGTYHNEAHATASGLTVSPTGPTAPVEVTAGQTPTEEQCTPLLAGQTINVGQVCVSHDATDLIVTYRTTGGWVLTETHLAVGNEVGDIPATRRGANAGQPTPGHFPHKARHSPAVNTYSYTMPLGDLDPAEGMVVAAHAKVQRVVDDTTAEESAWGAGQRFVQRGNWATYFWYSSTP